MQWKPNVTVAAIACRDGKYLLVEENADEQIVFNQPAGHLEEGESLLDAVKREVLEETRWHFEPESLVGVYLYPNPALKITYLRFCFAGTCTKEDVARELDTGIIRAVWMSREELEMHREKMRSPMVMQCIQDYLSGNRHSLDILNDYLL